MQAGVERERGEWARESGAESSSTSRASMLYVGENATVTTPPLRVKTARSKNVKSKSPTTTQRKHLNNTLISDSLVASTAMGVLFNTRVAASHQHIDG